MQTKAILVIVCGLGPMFLGSADACDCVKSEIVRIDDENQRFFATVSETSPVMIKAALYDLIGEIEAERPQWRENWSVSLFSSRRFAEYKDGLDPTTDRRDWANAYIAEYDHQAAKLTIWPLISSKRKTLEMKIE